MQQYLKLLGRDAVVINLDPANEGPSNTNNSTDTDSTGSNSALPYTAAYDICTKAISLSSVMTQLGLGPNGGLVYCMEYLEAHADEIVTSIAQCLSPTSYVLLDFPGQVELYTHSTCVQVLLQRLTQKLDLRLTAVQLIDALYCTDCTKFISAAVLGTTTMLRLELPTVSVLSKIDLLSTYGELPFQLDFFMECHDLDRLVPLLYSSPEDNEMSSTSPHAEEDRAMEYTEDPVYQKARRKRLSSPFAVQHERLHRAMAEIVDDYGLLSFLPLEIANAESVGRVLAKIDASNGYVFTQTTTLSIAQNDLFQCAVQQANVSPAEYYESLSDVRERISSPNSIRELEQPQTSNEK